MTRSHYASTQRVLALLASAGLSGAAHAAPLDITVENLLDEGSFYFTPVWMSVHNGSFDVFNEGEFADAFPGLTALAEHGNTGPLMDAFTSSPAGLAGGWQTTLVADDGPDDAPVFAPGESMTLNLDVDDPGVNRFFSYASMVVPSNDLFFANDDFRGIELFDDAGNFNGPLVILVLGGEVYDNGTEVNDAMHDAAFSTLDGQSIPEHELVRAFFTSNPDDQDYLDSFIGTEVANGDIIGSSFGPDEIVARITITPTPATAALLGLAGCVSLVRRRR